VELADPSPFPIRRDLIEGKKKRKGKKKKKKKGKKTTGFSSYSFSIEAERPTGERKKKRGEKAKVTKGEEKVSRLRHRRIPFFARKEEVFAIKRKGKKKKRGGKGK